MNQTLFDSWLSTAVSGDWVTPEKRVIAARRALLEYSRYKSCKRHLGDAQVAQPAKAGDTVLLLVGGVFAPGDAVKLDAGGWDELPLWIQTRAPQPSDGSVPLLKVTLSIALARDVQEGESITPASDSDRGLLLQTNRSLYPLPLDFLSPDADSFAQAAGLPGGKRRSISFYDSVYPLSALLSGTGAGEGSNFAGFLPQQPARPGVGNNTAVLPTSGMPGAGGDTPYFFDTNGERPRLLVYPAPGSDTRLAFLYNGAHTFASLPHADNDAVLAYARYALLSAEAADMGLRMNFSESGVSESPSGNAQVLLSLANAALEEYREKVSGRPICVSG